MRRKKKKTQLQVLYFLLETKRQLKILPFANISPFSELGSSKEKTHHCSEGHTAPVQHSHWVGQKVHLCFL